MTKENKSVVTLAFTESDLCLLLNKEIEKEQASLFYSDIKALTVSWIFDKKTKEQNGIVSESLVGSIGALLIDNIIDVEQAKKALVKIAEYDDNLKFIYKLYLWAFKDIVKEHELYNFKALSKECTKELTALIDIAKKKMDAKEAEQEAERAKQAEILERKKKAVANA